MSIVLFDCTQFISIKALDGSIKLINFLEDYKELGFRIVNEPVIKPQKLNYLKSYLEDFTFELEHDQFLGFFDKWKYKDIAPEEITRFASITKDLINNTPVEILKIIFVDYASENRELDHLIQVECNVNNIMDTLFYQSSSCFDAWGNIMIVTVRK